MGASSPERERRECEAQRPVECEYKERRQPDNVLSRDKQLDFLVSDKHVITKYVDHDNKPLNLNLNMSTTPSP